MTQNLLFPDLPDPITQPEEEKPAPKGPRLNPDGLSVVGCSYIYAPRGQAGEYSQLSANPYRGCGHKCAYCLDGDTLILMADGTSKPIKYVREGDEIFGVVNTGKNRAWNTRFAKTKVLATLKTRKTAYMITLSDGTSIVCSEDHRWLTERGWKYTASPTDHTRPHLTVNNSIRKACNSTITPNETDEFRLGYLSGMIRGDANLSIYDYSDRKRPSGKTAGIQYRFRLALKDKPAIDRTKRYLLHFGVTTTDFLFKTGKTNLFATGTTSPDQFRTIKILIEPRQNREWLRGWVSGIFDAEGSHGKDVIRITNTDQEILSTTEHALAQHGFKSVREFRSNHAQVVRLLGGRNETLRFWQLFAPSITRKLSLEGGAVSDNAKVVRISNLGYRIDMYDITTGTENFIANGMISHNCYVPDVLKMKREDFDAGAIPRPDFLKHLERDAAKYQALGITAQVMLSFTTDPFNPTDMSLTRPTIEILKRYGLAFCTLTKGGSRALPYMDLYRPDRDAFASTLTSLDDKFSLKWERGAQLPGDRIKTLQAFHDAGIFTWVSLEPTLDVEASLQIVRETHTFVDLYKVGRVNYIGMTQTTDWETYTHRMIELLQQVGAKHYIKKDLQKYLPPGYDNPRYIQQHN